jgi:hypothetical protein
MPCRRPGAWCTCGSCRPASAAATPPTRPWPLLLDRCLTTLQAAAPTARNWQARIVTHYGTEDLLRPIGGGVLHSVTHSCEDSGVQIVQSEAESGAPVTIGFRPAMGQFRKL